MFRRDGRCWPVAVLLIAAVGTPAASQQQRSRVSLATTRLVLGNGLTVLLNEDRSAPVAAVDVWYRVGSADENPGQAGFAHACEHLMGLSSPNGSDAASTFLRSIGAVSGGRRGAWATTAAEYTQYYETIPSDKLETVLAFEAARMAAPFARVDSQHFNSIRSVIRQERTLRVDNVPFGESVDITREAIFPKDDPLHSPPLAPLADLDTARLETVVDFCAEYYRPNNAIVAISGDFATDSVARLLRRYFEPIPRAQIRARRLSSATQLRGERRLVIQGPRANTSRLRFAWRAVGFSSPQKMPLYALAGVMSGDKYGFSRFGRLAEALMRKEPLATFVHAELYDFQSEGMFVIDVTARPGASLSRIERVVDSVIADLAATPIRPSELEAFANLNSVTAVTALQPRSARTDTLAQSEMWTHDPQTYSKQIARAFSIAPADVQKAARQFLGPSRVVVSMVPAGKLADISKPELPYDDVTPVAHGRTRPQ